MKFNCDDRVEIHSTTDVVMDGQQGKISGRSFVDNHMTIYIVDLDNPMIHSDGFLCRSICITEHCLR